MDARADASESEEDDYSDDKEQMRTGHGRRVHVVFSAYEFSFVVFDKKLKDKTAVWLFSCL